MPSHGQKGNDFVRFNDEVLFLSSEIYIKQGRTMVPAERLFEVFHVDLKIDLENKYLKAHHESVDITIPFDKNYAYINDERILLNISGEVINNQVYVPLRFVSEAFGSDVIWLREKGQVLIHYKPYKDQEVLELLEAIGSQSRDEKISYTLEREKFKEVLYKVNQRKEKYLNEAFKLNQALKELGSQVNLNLEDDSLKTLMVTFHSHWKNGYEKDLRDKAWVYEDDYYFLSFEEGYYYGYYHNYQANGYRFGYTSFEDGYILSLVPYKDNKRQGVGYKVVFNQNDVFQYDMFFEMEKNIGKGLEYVRYKNGVETFDRSDKESDTLVYIDEENNVFIPAINSEEVKVAYYKWSEGLEHVGFFQGRDRLGIGMYFGDEESSFEKDNLLKQRSLEIIKSLELEGQPLESQVKTIHDYLAENIRYDHSVLPKASSHTAYGALVLGEGVCDGYAESFKYLLDLIDLDNHLIFGSVNGDAHAWNLIKIKGNYYHFDLTWNDDDKGQVPVYTYYKRSSEFFNESHEWHKKRYEIYLGKNE
jgi:hypothetical protein